MSHPTPQKVVLSCEQLSCEVQSTLLLSSLTAEFFANEIVAIVGPSGAGKSTLLRLLNRLQEPSSGTIRLHGEDTHSLPPTTLRQRVGLVMQQAYLFERTIEDNLQYGPIQQGRSLSSDDMEALLKSVSLEVNPKDTVQTLSGGESQRVSLARSLANSPEVLLLDEPTSALDEAARLRIESCVKEWVLEERRLVLWVTHDLEQTRRIADRVLLLHQGQLLQLGLPEEVLHAFASLS